MYDKGWNADYLNSSFSTTAVKPGSSISSREFELAILTGDWRFQGLSVLEPWYKENDKEITANNAAPPNEVKEDAKHPMGSGHSSLKSLVPTHQSKCPSVVAHIVVSPPFSLVSQSINSEKQRSVFGVNETSPFGRTCSEQETFILCFDAIGKGIELRCIPPHIRTVLSSLQTVLFTAHNVHLPFVPLGLGSKFSASLEAGLLCSEIAGFDDGRRKHNALECGSVLNFLDGNILLRFLHLSAIEQRNAVEALEEHHGLIISVQQLLFLLRRHVYVPEYLL
jgi:hypothetical protein